MEKRFKLMNDCLTKVGELYEQLHAIYPMEWKELNEPVKELVSNYFQFYSCLVKETEKLFNRIQDIKSK